MIENRTLRYFLAIAQEQSITRAAEYLHITQPTLSKQMMDLEAQLGKQLFIRGPKRILLTEEGAYLRGKAQEIISLMETTEASFRDSEQIITGDVNLGCGEHRSSYPIMQLIKRIQDEYPGIHFHVFSGNADAITERLNKGLLDVGILLDPIPDPRYDYRKIPLQETWGVLLRKDDPLAEYEELTLEQLAGLPLLAPSQNSNHLFLEERFSAAGLPFTVAVTYNLIYNASLMVEAGIGYALCIDDLVNTANDSPLAFRPLAPRMQSDVYLFTKKYQVFSKAAKLFLARLKSEFSESE